MCVCVCVHMNVKQEGREVGKKKKRNEHYDTSWEHCIVIYIKHILYRYIYLYFYSNYIRIKTQYIYTIQYQKYCYLTFNQCFTYSCK